ncbi:hypothetical protein ACFFGH_07330 [Lysobacter korlensis]|uniref:Uncharacterized protein n=1 Tax=Lysobacter korlensis TaxID=553636 RepID=A0ABV6RP46_9GAMM
MATASPHYRIAKRASRFMLSFAKAQSLEAAFAEVPTPANQRRSTLGLLWGVILAHAAAERCDRNCALEVARLMLVDLPDGAASLRWLTEHRDDDEFQAWAELGAMAVERAARANDSMPALIDLARRYRAIAPDAPPPGRAPMPMPGSRLLADNAHRPVRHDPQSRSRLGP